MSTFYSCLMSIIYFNFAQSKGHPPSWNRNLQRIRCDQHARTHMIQLSALSFLGLSGVVGCDVRGLAARFAHFEVVLIAGPTDLSPQLLRDLLTKDSLAWPPPVPPRGPFVRNLGTMEICSREISLLGKLVRLTRGSLKLADSFPQGAVTPY